MATHFYSYWSTLSPQEKSALAERAGTSVAYLRQIASGYRNAGTKTINALTQADPNITLAMFFDAA